MSIFGRILNEFQNYITSSKLYTQKTSNLVNSLRINKIFYKIKMRFQNDIRLSVDQASGSFDVSSEHEYRHLTTHFNKEEKIVRDIISEVDGGDVFWDVGANIGIYAVLIGKCRSDVSVCAFEANPNVAQRLRENINENSVNAEVFHTGLYDEDARLKMSMPVQSTGVGGSTEEEYGEFEQVVQCMRAVDIVRRYNVPRPTVLKIDVEGAGLKVLKGLDELTEQIRLIYFEVHGYKNKELEYLDSLGFRTEVLQNGEDRTFIKASKGA